MALLKAECAPISLCRFPIHARACIGNRLLFIVHAELPGFNWKPGFYCRPALIGKYTVIAYLSDLLQLQLYAGNYGWSMWEKVRLSLDSNVFISLITHVMQIYYRCYATINFFRLAPSTKSRGLQMLHFKWVFWMNYTIMTPYVHTELSKYLGASYPGIP